jgi:cell fate (sporulation/competence/biofilm development) regulator YlbF (YheA/YmcA/DUF963 family)
MSVETADGDADEGTDVEELGRELGEAIADLPVYREFEEAKAAVEADEEAQERIAAFESRREEFMTARQLGNATQSDLQELQEVQQELHALPVMEEFLQAQAALQDRLEDVNVAISEPLAVDFGGEAGGCCQD